jgi:formylglycine-generating enzyme
MKEEYKYDVAISFAEEDKPIAKIISSALKDIGLVSYFYEDENAENWGENLFNIIINRYREEARFSLILISKNYLHKKWANIERQIIETIPAREGSAYLLPLIIDDVKSDWITDSILTVRWKDNPKEIALMIKEKMDKISEKQFRNEHGQENKKENGKSTTIVGSVGRDFNQINNY